MKIILTFLLALSLGVSAQTPELIPYLKNKRWGFVNRERAIIVPCMYDYAYPFSEGLALVEMNRKYGYIDTKGKVVIPFKYDKAYSFKNGRARVETIFGKKTSNQFKSGYIDKTGKEVISLKYFGITSFRDSIAMVWDGSKNGYIDWQGKTLLVPQYAYATRFREGRALVAAKPPRYDPALGTHIFAKAFFIDIKGKVQATLTNAGAESYAQERALVIAKVNDSTQAMYFIDKQGEKVLDVSQYEAVHGFTEGLAAVMQNGKVGFINFNGKLVIPCHYPINAEWFRQEHKRRLPKFINGLTAIVLPPHRAWNMIDKKGKISLVANYQYLQVVSANQILAKKNNKWGIIDSSGKILLPLHYDSVKPYRNGLALVRKGRHWFYVDKEGEEYFE